jgi:hypothetical protein
MKLPRTILFDLDDTILVAFGPAPSQWQRSIAAFADQLGPIEATVIASVIEAASTELWADPARHKYWRHRIVTARRRIVAPSSASKCRMLSVSIRLTRLLGSEAGIKPSWVSGAPKTSNESFWIGPPRWQGDRDRPQRPPRHAQSAQSQDAKVRWASTPATGSHGLRPSIQLTVEEMQLFGAGMSMRWVARARREAYQHADPMPFGISRE